MALAPLTNDHDHPLARSAAEVRGSGHVPSSRHLDVVREMIRMLETLTLPGQHHTMARIVGLIDEQAARCHAALSARNRIMLEQLREQLTRESQRILPDARSFGSHAEALVGLLAGVQR